MDELGGADVHCRISGLSDHYANNEAHALEICREVVAKLNHHSYLEENLKNQKLIDIREPLYSPEELKGIVPDDIKQTYDIREVIARVVDGSE